MTSERSNMKIVVIGGSGLIGSKLIVKLREHGHQAVSASPASGVNTLTGEGLAEVLEGAAVVVDVSNSPSFADAAVMEFFKTSTGNLLTYEAAAGVGHHVALSVVGCDHLPDSGYLRAKVAQEKLIKESSIPYSIVRATQFFEFVNRIADSATDGNTVRLPPVRFQPLAADDVASAVARVAMGSPLNGIVEIAGPEQFRFDELIHLGLSVRKDPREVVADPHARYFGTELSERSLVPGDNAVLGETRFEDWLSRSASQIPPTPQPAVAASIDPAALKENEFRTSEVPPGSALLVGDVAAFNIAGSFCATQAKCTHRQGPLSKGKLDGSTVTCPIHGAQFNVCTGEVLRGPAQEPLKTYRVIVDGEIGRLETGAAAGAKTT
ncbi:MAG: Rieske 2Fe-2S domain-containing protein [Pyrinomonadaceae bacterium]|nr:Rieske 2Fe-2S domain-containing protein [Pyrinomonadaceae bacterium]